MEKVLKKITKKLKLSRLELFALLSIFITSLFLRFVNYSNRWGLASDQARDVIVSQQILENAQLPISGPFSASGPFVFGPIWYWFHSFVTFLNPSSVMWLWYVQTAISSFMPLVMFYVGRRIIDVRFGLLLAFFTAVSTAQIAQSTNLTYSTFAGFISVFILLFFALHIKTGKSVYVFLTSFSMGLAMNVHFQAVGFFLMLPVLIFLNIKNIKNIFLILSGFLIPFIPLIIFDVLSNHYQSNNILEYLFNRGNNTAMPKRWLTYVGEYWPNAYSHIIGGYYPLGWLVPIAAVIVTSILIWKRKIEKTVLLIGIFFIFNFVVLRYFKGNIYDAFLVFLHPSILLLTAWSVYKIIKWKLIIGVILLITISFFTLVKNYEEISNATNHTATSSVELMNELQDKYPNKKFAVYDYEYKNSSRSYSLVMYLMKNNLISDNGIKIGFLQATLSAEIDIHNAPLIRGKANERPLLDLSKYNNDYLVDKGWIFVNPNAIYDSVINWYEKEKQK